MALSVKTGQFTKGAGSTTTVSGLGFRLKAGVFWTANTIANTTITAHLHKGYGVFADVPNRGVRQQYVWSYFANGVTTTAADAGSDDDKCCGTKDWQIGSLVPASDGFTVTWTGTAATGTIVNYLVFGGSDLQADLFPSRVLTTPATSAGIIQHFSGLQFTPTAAIVPYSGYVTLTSVGTPKSYGAGIGFMAKQLESLNFEPMQNTLVGYGQHNVAAGTSAVIRSALLNPVAQRSVALGVAVAAPSLSITNSQPFSVDVSFSPDWSGATDFSYAYCGLLLGGVHAKLTDTTKSVATAPATQAIAPGFKAKAVLLATNASTSSGINNSPYGDHNSFGASDGTTHVSALWNNVELSPTTAQGYTRNDQAIVKSNANAGIAVQAAATVTLTATGYSIAWGTNDTEATRITGVAFGEITKPVGTALAAQSKLEPSRFPNIVPVSSTIRAHSDIIYAIFGTTGNLSPITPVAAVSALTIAKTFGFPRPLTANPAGLSALTTRGLGMMRPLSATIPAQALLAASKAGNDAMLDRTTIAAVANLSAIGIRLSHNLVTALNTVSTLDAFFRIFLPVVRDPLPTELAGTVNWVNNPSLERSGFGWNVVNGATLTRTQAEAWDGTWAMQVTTPGATAAEGVAIRSVTGLELTGRARTIWSQARLKGPAAGLLVWTRLTYKDLTVTDGEAAAVSLGTDWTLVYPPAVVLNPAKTLIRAEMIIATATAVARTFYADGGQIEEDRGQGPTAWVTGDYGKQTGVWTGMPHGSMSLREPLPMVIAGTGRGGAIEIEATMYRATYDNQWLEDVSDAVIEAKVSMDPERETTWTLDAKLTRDGYDRLTPNLDWLAPVLTVRYPDGTVKTGQLGLYFVVPSEEDRGEYDGTVTLSAFDPLWLIARGAMTGPLVARPGSARVHVVKQVLDGAVLQGHENGIGARYAIEHSERSFKKRYEWSRDTDRISVCNEVLEGINYYPLWTTAQGIITSRWRGAREQRLRDLTPVRAWAAHIPDGVSVGPWIPRVASLNSEVVGRIQTTPKAHDMFDEILLINDDPNLPRIHVRGKVKGGNHKKDNTDRDHDGNRRDRHDERREERRDDRDDRDRRQRERDRERKQDHRSRQRDRGNPRVVFHDHGRRRTKRLYAPFVDDQATAEEVAAALTDELSTRTETVKLSVLPDPSVDYARQTVVLAIWDAYQEPIAVGQFVVRRVEFGFTPSSCVQTMELDYVDNGETEIEVA